MRQTILVLLLVIAVAASAFMWYGLRGQESDRVGVASPVNNPEVAEFRRLLAALKVIKLDTEFFNDPAYKSLVDPRVLISKPSVYGRSNPFVPLGAQVVLPTR